MAKDYIPNDLLREARERLFGTQQAMAEAANKVLPPAYWMNGNDIGKLERGVVEKPSPPRCKALRTICGVTTNAEIGLVRRPNTDTSSRGNPCMVETAGHPDKVDHAIHPGNGMPQTTAATNEIAARGTEVDLVEFASSLDRRGISAAELTAVELAGERLDKDFAQTPSDEVLTKIRMLMTRVSTHLRQSQTLRHHERLVRLAARLSGLRAWACFDIDEHGEADRWYEVAVSAASEAKAWGLGAWLLGAQSLIPWHRRDLSRAVEFVERGIYFASQGSDVTTRAWLHALHARGCAGMGNGDGFNNAYDLAQEAAEYSSERDRRHGMDFTQGTLDLRYYSGTSRLLLRQPKQARLELTGSLAALPESHTKARAVLSLFLADAAVQSGDDTQATDLAHHALASTIQQPIVPILQQARRIRRLVQQRDPDASDSLNDRIQEFSLALAAVAGKAK